MGAGASFDVSNNTHEEYFCHSCRRAFGISNPLAGNMICPFCSHSCIEEIGSFDPYVSRPNIANMTAEQSTRLNNAALMLRILEHQLRRELEGIQSSLARSEATSCKTKALAKAALSTLKIVPIDVEMLCSQPSCPICSEDYSVGEKVTQLPCSHVYHKLCVSDWLEMKETCPICRFDISNRIPTVAEIQELSDEELKASLKSIGLNFDEITDKY